MYEHFSLHVSKATIKKQYLLSFCNFIFYLNWKDNRIIWIAIYISSSRHIRNHVPFSLCIFNHLKYVNSKQYHQSNLQRQCFTIQFQVPLSSNKIESEWFYKRNELQLVRLRRVENSETWYYSNFRFSCAFYFVWFSANFNWKF